MPYSFAHLIIPHIMVKRVMRLYGLDDAHAEVLRHWIDRLEREYRDPQTDIALEVRPPTSCRVIGAEPSTRPELGHRGLLREGLRRDMGASSEAVISILVIIIVVCEQALLIYRFSDEARRLEVLLA